MTKSSVIPTEPTDYFSRMQWSALTEVLRTIEGKICVKAKQLGLLVKSDSRWPSLTVYQRHLAVVRSVNIRLDADSFSAGRLAWNVDFEEILHAWIFFYRLRKHVRVSSLSDEQMRDGESCFESVDRAIEVHLLRPG